MPATGHQFGQGTLSQGSTLQCCSWCRPLRLSGQCWSPLLGRFFREGEEASQRCWDRLAFGGWRFLLRRRSLLWGSCFARRLPVWFELCLSNPSLSSSQARSLRFFWSNLQWRCLPCKVCWLEGRASSVWRSSWGKVSRWPYVTPGK